MNQDEEWLQFLDRWDRLLDGLRGRVPDDQIEETRFEGCQEPLLGIAGVLGAHEQGMWNLTPAEEDEAWDLASFMYCSDEDVMNEWVRERSVRNRPIRRVRPRFPLTGGGHGARSGKPGKRAFPEAWTDDEAILHTMSVAREPSRAVKLPTGDFVAHGEREGVLLGVVVSPEGEVLTSYPVQGPGVVQNQTDEFRGPAADRLQELVQAVLPEDHELRQLLDELHAVGEWPYVVKSLRILDLPMTDAQRAALTELASLAGLRH